MQFMSMLLNFILLSGVIAVIVLIMKSRRHIESKPASAGFSNSQEPALGNVNALYAEEDIIAVRKTSTENIESIDDTARSGPLLMMYLLAPRDNQFIGYELLQALLSNGMRFGDMSLFHRHQEASGKGPVLFSLANASEDGTFEIQKMGAFATRGLCLYMHLSGNRVIDGERFTLMLNTAKQLALDLDARLLDEQKCLLDEQSIKRYMEFIESH